MNLLQRIGQFFSTPPAPIPTSKVLTTERAVDMYSTMGFLQHYPDPDEVLKRSGIGREGLRTLEYDDEISAALETRRLAVSSTPWRIMPAPNSGRAGKKAAEAICANLDEFMPSIIRNAHDAVAYGYAVQERIYRKEGGLISLDSCVLKPMEWFAPHPGGGLVFFPWDGLPEVVDIGKKFLFTSNGATQQQPQGVAMLSRVYFAWQLRQEGWAMWARYLERHGAPMLVGKLTIPEKNPSIKDEDWQSAVNAALSGLASSLDRAVRSATVATTADITAISPSNTGEAFASFNQELNKRIQKVILGQTLTSDVGSTGSYAASKTHNEVRLDRRNADLALIKGTIQNVINALADLNGWPRPVFDWILESELEIERAKRDAALKDAGLINPSIDYMMDKYGFEPGELLPLPEVITPTLGFSSDTMFSAIEPTKFTPGQQAVEDETDKIIKKAGQPVSQELILSAIRGSENEEDLTNRLKSMLSTDDSEFQYMLAKSQFAAELLGYIHAKERTQ